VVFRYTTNYAAFTPPFIIEKPEKKNTRLLDYTRLLTARKKFVSFFELWSPQQQSAEIFGLPQSDSVTVRLVKKVPGPQVKWFSRVSVRVDVCVDVLVAAVFKKKRKLSERIKDKKARIATGCGKTGHIFDLGPDFQDHEYSTLLGRNRDIVNFGFIIHNQLAPTQITTIMAVSVSSNLNYPFFFLHFLLFEFIIQIGSIQTARQVFRAE
jgi:hypothetical protein